MTSSVKTWGATAGSLLLLSSAALAAAPAVMGITAEAAPEALACEAGAEGARDAAGARAVEGQFSYDQGAVTSNAEISSVFAKAAATLCDGAHEPAPGVIAQAIKVTCATGGCLEATVADLAGEEGADSYVIGCSCASNAPGGGAIANAEVSGITVATLMALAAA